MNSEQRLSPRQEALDAILATSADTPGTTIGRSSWGKLVSLAWDNRSHVGDRRDIQRELRSILLEASREGSTDHATD